MPPFPSPDEILKKSTGSSLATPQIVNTIPSPASILQKVNSSVPDPTKPSFVSNLVSTAKSAVKTVATKISDFVNTNVGNIKSVASGETKVTPADVLEGIKTTAIGSGNAITSLSQGFNEGVARIAKSTIQAVAGPEITQKLADSSIGDFGKVATGRQNTIDLPGAAAPAEAGRPIFSYQQIHEKALQYATDNNATPDQASTFAGIAVMGMMLADNPAFGPEKGAGKGIFKLSEDGVKALAEATDDQVLFDTLKREVPNLTNENAQALMPIFKNASTPEEVKSIADQISKSQTAASEAKAPELPPPEEVFGRVKSDPALRPQDLELPESTPHPQFNSDEISQKYYDQTIAPKTSEEPIVIAGDDMKSYFGKDFDPGRSDVYSKAAYQNVQRAIEENPGREFTFLAGGPGAGKTELLGKSLIDSGYKGILYDNSLSNYDGVVRLIEKARAEGSPINIAGIVADVDEARKFTLKRELETGRPVTPEAFTHAHAGFSQTALKLIENGVIDPKEMTLFDLRGVKTADEALKRIKLGVSAQNPIDLLKKVQYDEVSLLARVKKIKYDDIRSEGIPEESRVRGANDQAPRSNGADRGSEDVGRRAPGESQGSPERVIGFSPNLVKGISEQGASGPIADLLKKEFPAISDSAAASIAKRLLGMKKTENIEGILRVAKDVNERLEQNAPAAASARAAKREAAAKKAPGIPPSVAEILDDQQTQMYLDSVDKELKAKENAVLAQQEYNALFEQADQKVIDRLNELQLSRDIMREVVSSHPGKGIADLYRGTFKSPDNISVSELLEQSRGKKFKAAQADSYATELGFKDLEDAQKGLDAYRQSKAQLDDINKEIRDIRPAARAASMAQTMVKDVPVISRDKAGDIEALTSAGDIRNKYKDISGFTGQTKDVYRIFEQVFGENFPAVKKAILDPFDKSKGDMIDEITNLGDRVEEGVIKKFNIKRGSKADAAIQLYGEGKLTQEELIKMVGSNKVEDVVNAGAFFRKEYDRLIDEVNEVRKKIYPNNPGKLIAKRKDYFRHFQELGDTFQDLMSLFETPAGIDPKLAGVSEFTKPASKYLSFAQQRLGNATDESAIGGFLNYAPSFSYAKHIDQHIGNFRYLRRRLADEAPTPGVRELVPAADTEAAAMGGQDLVKQPGLNNFLEYMDDFANDLAGKTNPFDRWIQKTVPGGRKTLKVVNWVNSRVKANQILGNLSSAIAQIFNVPQGIASAKLYSVPGLYRTIAGNFMENEPMKASSFLKERYAQPLTSRFNVSWLDHPIKAETAAAKEFAGWITGVLDEAGTKFIWNSHYQKALGEGIADPIKYADATTRKLVAGRGVGEVPLLQKSKIFQLIAPFQLEVGNSWHVLKDFVKAKDFGAIAAFFVTSYLMNRAAEHVRGSPVVFDPIESLIEGGAQFSDEYKDGNPERGAIKFLGRQAGEILSNIPLGQTFASAIPDTWVQGATQEISGAAIDKEELFGNADPGRFGGGLLAVNGLTDPLYKLLLPFGGAQVKRTVQGMEAVRAGEVRDAGGKLSFKTGTSPLSLTQAFLFGKNATPEAQAFYDQRDDLFNRIYRQDAQRTELGFQAEQKFADLQKLAQTDPDAAAAQLQDLEQNNPDLADAIGSVADDAAKGLDGSDRLVKMLGVENGERAKYIADQLSGMKREDQITFLQNLDDKGLISDQVFEQLTVLLPPILSKQN